MYDEDDVHKVIILQSRARGNNARKKLPDMKAKRKKKGKVADVVSKRTLFRARVLRQHKLNNHAKLPTSKMRTT